jgi:hypothetical protein
MVEIPMTLPGGGSGIQQKCVRSVALLYVRDFSGTTVLRHRCQLDKTVSRFSG